MAFNKFFEDLTGFKPLSWQTRLYEEYFASADLPAAVDIPTGLGKTAVMALWLIARAGGASLPHRLVYVVDRRAVVDQATEFAMSLRHRLDMHAPFLKAGLHVEDRSLPISTLRGQFADNREWLEDPALSAIIVGTVDMIGSRLLFEGYGVSRKMRPYHAGLLGADTLVVLDEAHLVPPFERLLERIEGSAREFGALASEDRDLIPAFKLLSLSATGGDRTGKVFRLKGSFDAPAGSRDDLDDATVERRLKAEKLVTLVPNDSGKIEETLAAEAWSLAEQGNAPIRCLVFSNSREIAEKARKRIELLAKGDRQRAISSTEIDTELFVGARRVRERESVSAEWLKSRGFLAGSVTELRKPAFLFATSAGEVGVDLDADHIVCDLVAWERLIQRFGRVNRRGGREAKILIVDKGVPEPKKKDAPTSEELAKAQQYTAVRALLEELPKIGTARLASPDALRGLKERASRDPKLAATLKSATTTAPLRPALTRATVEAWSMTSLADHTGRPEVAPWLRGWVDEHPQTTVVWRKYLPTRTHGNPTHSEIESFFEAAPPHVSEQLDADTFVVDEWLRARCEALLKVAKPTLESTAGEDGGDSVSAELSRADVVAFLLSQAGDRVDAFSLADFSISKEDRAGARELERRLRRLTESILIVDARLGGIDKGLLRSESSTVAETADDVDNWMPPLSSSGQKSSRLQPVVKFRVRMLSDSAAQGSDSGWLERYSFTVESDADGIATRWLVIEKWRGDSSNEDDRSASINPQLLAEHQSWAEDKARVLATRLGLREDIAEVITLAARLHDEGKKSSRWQRAFRAPTGHGAYAKTTGPINFALLDGYRHEFGSLASVEQDASFQALPDKLKDLLLHLVAAHHGQARPVIGTRSCEDAPPSVLEERARQVALRFARLQKQWGPWGLAWLESLLRAADQQASRANDEKKSEKPHG